MTQGLGFVLALAAVLLLAACSQKLDGSPVDIETQGSLIIAVTVWNDIDGDGFRDIGEPGLGNVSVRLTGELLDTSGPTGAQGDLLFLSLYPGLYQLEVTDTAGVLAGFTPTFDSDGIATPGQVTVNLSDGEPPQIEFGYGPFLAAIEAVIDIKPGSDPNCINNNGHGAIPVAIFGSDLLDVTEIDLTLLSLEGLTVRTVGQKNKFQAHFEDLDADNNEDLVVQFEDVAGAFDASAGTATVTGALFDGRPVVGTDTICLTPANDR